MTTTQDTTAAGFDTLGLAKPLLDALAEVGYETPVTDPGGVHSGAAGRQ
jgi:hypothetical protein